MLTGPAELLDLMDGGSITTRILAYSFDHMTINVGPAKTPKIVNALRITVPPTDKTHFPFYWDITAQTLIAQLLPILEKGNYQARRFTITKHGNPPSARFSLGVM